MNPPGPSHRRSSRASTRSAVEEVAQLAVAGPDHAQATHRKLGPTDVVAKETPADEIRGVSASARLLDLHPPSTAERTFSGRSTATGFASGASDATHMVLREGEGEASTPRLQRAEAKRAAQNNLKRKLEKLAARRHCGTFLAPTKVQKRSIVESESEVEQGRDVAERAVFKTPPRSASAIAADGEAARPQAEGPEGDERRARESELRLEEANRLGTDVCPDVAGALNAQCMAGIANARLFSGPETDRETRDALAETNDDGCSVASDTGCDDGSRDRGDLADAFAGEEEALDADGSGRRTLRNLLVRHVNTGIASDAVALVPPRFASGSRAVARETSAAAAEDADARAQAAPPNASATRRRRARGDSENRRREGARRVRLAARARVRQECAVPRAVGREPAEPRRIRTEGQRVALGERGVRVRRRGMRSEVFFIHLLSMSLCRS